MAYPTFPFSPLPGGTERFKDWNENVDVYDSGAEQAGSPFLRPLYNYTIPIKNMQDTKQQSLWAFWDTVKGRVSPFLMMDPYDYSVNSVLGVDSGVTNAATLQLYDTRSYLVRADTTTIGSLFSAASGYVTLGSEYSYDQDNNILTVNTKVSSDVWGVRSMFYFKKCKFAGPYVEQSPLWNTFNTTLKVREVV